MRWTTVVAAGAVMALATGTARAEDWARLETSDQATAWGVDPDSIRRPERGPVRAWFIRAIPPIGEDSPDYRLSLEAFHCDGYLRVTETVVDYRLESYGEFEAQRRDPNTREEVTPNTIGYALLEAACDGRGHGRRSWSERAFVEDFRREWEAQNWNDEPPYQIGEQAPWCLGGSYDCEVWERAWRGRGLAEGARVDWDGNIVAAYP